MRTHCWGCDEHRVRFDHIRRMQDYCVKVDRFIKDMRSPICGSGEE